MVRTDKKLKPKKRTGKCGLAVRWLSGQSAKREDTNVFLQANDEEVLRTHTTGSNFKW